jgi:hypothetical protein
MRERPGIAGGPVFGLFVGDDDDVTDDLTAAIDPGFAVVGDVHGLVRAHEKRESLLEREASNDPRNFICFCAEKGSTNSLTVHALSENQD